MLLVTKHFLWHNIVFFEGDKYSILFFCFYDKILNVFVMYFEEKGFATSK